MPTKFPDCLSTHRFAGFDGQQSGRENIFLRKCKHLLPKNTRNDVHAVISDLSLVLPILCQCSAPAVRPSAGGGLDVDGPSIDGETRLSTPKRLAEIFRQPQTVEKPKRGAKPFHTSIVPGGVYGGGARRPRAVRETGRSKPNEAGSSASELASAVERPC